METTAPRMTHKEMTAHIRGRLKAAGIPAHCKMKSYCGYLIVSVSTVSYESKWTTEQGAAIALIAKVNGLRQSQGHEIYDVYLSGQVVLQEYHFYFYPELAPFTGGIACPECGEYVVGLRPGRPCYVCRSADAMWNEFKAGV